MHGTNLEGGWGRPAASRLAPLGDTETVWDLVVVGGGITGAGVLREAARRGLRALMLESRDFAWGTSSRSSKMVHGGLRYLGSGQFKLTRDSVRERERLLREAPGLVERLPFLMPHYRGVFPGPGLFNALLWIYDRMAGHHDRRFHRPDEVRYLVPGLKLENLKGATEFADAVTDDARLTLRVLDEAVAAGARAINYARVEQVIREDGRVSGVLVRDAESGRAIAVRARAVVNATGAWVEQLRGTGGDRRIRPLRGSHLVIPFWRLPVATSLSFFHPRDRRPVFVFPWEGVTVIGTTDLDHREDLDNEARIALEEIAYLLQAANSVFPTAYLTEADIQGTWAGVRPVIGGHSDDPSKEKREHVVWEDQGLVSVSGGKLTTFRLIALDVLDHLQARGQAPVGDRHTKDDLVFQPAPGGVPRPEHLSAQRWRRLGGHYGRALGDVLAAGPAEAVAQTDTLWCELAWAASAELVMHLDDLMLRRTRLGLLLPRGGMDLMPSIRACCQPALGWSDDRWVQEVDRYGALWQRHYGVPDVGGKVL